MTLDRSPVGLATLFAEIGAELSSYDTRSDVLTALGRIAIDRVPGAEWASVSEGRQGRFSTVAATDDAARRVDELQYELRTGPCVDAMVHDSVFRTDDLPHDDRWPGFARRAADCCDVHSMLSFRLFLEDDDRIAGLNLYATGTAAFDERSEIIGTLVATHGALATAAATARERAAQLERALRNSREIGTAMGVLMNRHKLTRQQAFDLLRVASQDSNRKLADIATDVADTGVLLLPRARARRGGQAAG